MESVSGGAHWGGGIWMNSLDLARFGLLYLRGGRWVRNQVVTSGWIEMTRSPCGLNPMYGYLWWLQHDHRRRQVSLAAQGGGSHQCFVIPDHDLVVVVKWIADDAWMAFLDLALGLVTDRPSLGPVRYLFDEVNQP
jgi:CubicO group peptidase (beta-lactamase class C family)